MEGFDGRHVCMSDLKKYLKKDEYLYGYTELEKVQVRQNIGAISREDVAEIPEIHKNLYIEDTYAEIEKLVQSNGLLTGYRYAVNDFQSIYLSNTEEVWGDSINPSSIYTIILTAVNDHQFDPRVTILSNDYSNSYKWIAEYDFTSEVLKDDKRTKGKITFLKDTNNNSAYYDFKNIKCRRTKSELAALGINITQEHKDLYTFNTSSFEEASETFNVYNNNFDMNCFNNAFIGNNCSNNIFKAGFQNNTFVNICQNCIFGFDTKNNNFKDSVIYLSGSISNKNFIDKNYTSMDITKEIHKVDEGYVITYLDPDTLTMQVLKI